MRSVGACCSSISLRAAVRTLEPGYFAVVMATGIVSTAACLLKLHTVSAVLLWIAGIVYAVLVVGNVARIILFGRDFRDGLADPERSFTLFTFVAGTDVLAARLLLDGHVAPAVWLSVVGGLSWLVLGYLIPWTAVLGQPGQPALSRVNGTWFLAVVAAQSVAVMAAGLQPLLGETNRPLALLAVLLLVAPLRRVLGGALGRDLIPVIQATGFAEIGVGLGLLVGVFVEVLLG